ncbi:MAG: hypothetical protein ACREON_08660, partial [Gemmatimonadaceae bacterium]
PGRRAGELLAAARWPRPGEGHKTLGREFELVREAVSAVRQIRAEYSVPPGTSVRAVLVPATADARRILSEEVGLIGSLARASVTVAVAPPADAAGHVLLGDGTQVIVPLAGAVDVSKECGRLQSELTQLDKQLASLRQRLANESFTTRAPANVVEGEREKEREWSARRARLGDKVKSLCGG